MDNFRDLRDQVKEVSIGRFILLFIALLLLRYALNGYLSVIVSFSIYFLFLRTIRGGSSAGGELEIIFERKWTLIGSAILLSFFSYFVLSIIPEITVETFIINTLIRIIVNVLLTFINLFTVFCILDNYGNAFNIIFVGIRFIFSEISSIITVSLFYIIWQMAVSIFLFYFLREDLLRYALTDELGNLLPFFVVTSIVTVFAQTKLYLYCAAIYDRG